ncbi:MAG: flagellin [Bryobacteraceae bacterium]|nr:flagellin [Bryobacteraceae bacterium]
MNSTLPVSDRRFLIALESISQRMAKAQTQISSGLRIAKPSDAPDEVSNLLTARAELERVKGIESNLGRIKSETDAAEQSLANSVQAIERLRTLAAQTVNGTQTAESRAQAATEAANLIQQLTVQANSFVGGRYLFAGDADGTQPYTFDDGPPLTVSAYAGSAATRRALHPAGDTFPIGLAGDTIFSSATAGANAIDTAVAFHAALLANDEAGITTALMDLTTVGTHMNDMLAYYGGVQNRVAGAIDFASQARVRLETEISSIADADYTAAIVELEQAQFSQEAALQSKSYTPRTSLFDYLR